MDTPKNISFADNAKFLALCDRIVSVYKEVIGSDHPEAPKLANDLHRCVGNVWTAKRRIERSTAKSVTVQGDKK